MNGDWRCRECDEPVFPHDGGEFGHGEDCAHYTPIELDAADGPAAREALLRYAEVIEDDELAAALRQWVASERRERQEVRADGGETTYKYVSLMRCQGGNSAWDDEDGEKAVFAGKRPETWMPRVIAETEDGKDVIAACYKREAIAELPEWMTAEDAFAWVKEQVPDGFGDYYEPEVMTDGGQAVIDPNGRLSKPPAGHLTGTRPPAACNTHDVTEPREWWCAECNRRVTRAADGEGEFGHNPECEHHFQRSGGA